MKSFSIFPFLFAITLFVNAQQQIDKDSIANVKQIDKDLLDTAQRIDFDDLFKRLGFKLPPAAKPMGFGTYLMSVRTGNLLFLSGIGPIKADGISIKGKLGKDLDLVAGYNAAEVAGLCALVTLKKELGDLNRIKRIVKVTGAVNCSDEFRDSPIVIDGFSNLMIIVFGKVKGKHARSTFGVNSLSSDMAVQIEMIVEIE